MKKLLLSTIFLALIFGLVSAKSIYASEYTIVHVKSDSKSYKDFGKATMKLLDKKQYKFACSDARMLYTMMSNAANSAKNRNKSETKTEKVLTPAELELKNTMDSFGSQLKKYENNTDAMNGIGNGVGQILQIIMLKELVSLSNDEVEKYIDIELCDKKAPKGWVSPIEQFEKNLGK